MPFAVVLVLLLGAVLLFLHGIELDLERFRPRIERALTESLGTTVRVQRLRVRLAPRCELSLVAGSIGPEGSEWLVLGRAEAEVELWPLLRRRELRIGRVGASDLSLDLGQERPRPPRGPPSASPLRLTTVGELALEHVGVVFPPESASRIEVRRLAMAAPEGKPIEWAAEGDVLAARLELADLSLSGRGGTLEELQGVGSWPLRLALAHEGVAFDLETDLPALGSLAPGPGAPRAPSPLAARADLEAETLRALFDFLGLDAPGDHAEDGSPPGLSQPARMTLELLWQDERLTATGVAALAGATVSGDLELVEGGQRPLLSGRLEAATLDLAPWTVPATGSDPEGQSSEREPLEDWRRFAVEPPAETLRGLAIDLDLAVKVGEIRGPRLDLTSLVAEAVVEEGRVELPFEGVLQGSPVEGTARLESRPPGARLSLVARDVRLDRWLEDRSRPDRLDSLEVEAETSGPTLGSWVDNLRVDLGLRGLRVADLLPRSGSTRVPLVVEELRASQGQELDVRSSFRLLDRPFEGELSTLSIGSLLRRPSSAPLRLDLRSGEGRASVRGTLGLPDGRGTELAMQLVVDRLGGLTRWIAAAEPPELPLELDGRVTVAEDEVVTVEASRLEVGATQASAHLEWDPRAKRLSAMVSSALLDLDELLSVPEPTASADTLGQRGDRETPPPRPTSLTNWRELPIIPAELEGREISIDARIDRLRRHGIDFDAAAVRFDLSPDGAARSAIDFAIGSARFHGDLSIERPGDEAPILRLSADTESLDLRALRATDDPSEVDLEIGRLGLVAEARGVTLGELVDSARERLEIEEAVYWLHDREGRRTEPLRVTSATVETSAESTRASGEGSFRDTPLSAEVETGPLRRVVEERGVPFLLALEAPDASVRIEGKTRSEDESFDLAVEARGDHLSALDFLLGGELSSSSPFEVTGRLRGRDRRWVLEEAILAWEQSKVEGRLEADLEPDRPRLSGSLRAPRLRVVDLLPPARNPGEAEAVSSAGASTRTAEGGATQKGRSFQFEELNQPLTLERDFLPAIDLDLTLSSASLELADGLAAEIAGTIALDDTALDVAIDGHDSRDARLRARFRLEPGTTRAGVEGVRLGLEASLDDFDYSQVTRHFEEYAEEEGRLGFYLDFDSEAAWGSPLFAEADGTVAVMVKPRHFEALAIDLWAADLATSLIPKLGWARSPSTINCLAAYARFEQGRSEEVRAILDTQRVRVKGRGEVDLGERSLDLKLKPIPKRRTLVNLGTPVRITGKNGHFSVRITSSGLLWTLVRVQYYLYTFYLQVFKQPLPVDGTDSCLQLFEGKIEEEKWRPGTFLLAPEDSFDGAAARPEDRDSP